MRHLITAALLLLCALAPAHAAPTRELDVTMTIDQSTPTNPVEQSISLGRHLQLSDITIDSDWSFLDCVVDDGELLAVFKGTATSWPSTWPTEAVCEVSWRGDTYKVNVQIASCGTKAWCQNDASYRTSTTLPACSTKAHVVGENQAFQYACNLGAPPSGKAYTIPEDNLHRWAGRPAWYARVRLGASPAASDPEAQHIHCGAMPWGPNGTSWAVYYMVGTKAREVTSTTPGPYYCPIRLLNTTSFATSWDDPVYFTLDRQ